MSFLTAPILITPLLKVPLLLSHAAFTYYGMTPPSAPPSAKEQANFNAPDLLTRTHRYRAIATVTSKYIFCGVALAEAAVLLAQSVPSPLSERILALLFPADGLHAGPLQLTAASAIGCLLGITGGLIRVSCHRTLGRFFTWQVAVRDDHKLITSGPYAIVRHPSYTGWTAMIAGNAVLLLSCGSYFVESGLYSAVAGKILAIASVAYTSFIAANLLSRVSKEDAVLKKEFGSQWDTWAKSTPYRLIPLVY